MKPRLKLIDGLWQCAGGGIWAYGNTPIMAFGRWLEQRQRCKLLATRGLQ